MAKNFSELRNRMSAAAQAKARALADEYREEMTLDELREARALTQQFMADALGVSQPHISRIEKRADLYISTLQNFVSAMGGSLELLARFPDGRVQSIKLGQLRKKKKTA